LVQDAELFLQGKTTAVQADLAKQMATASEAMEFERAASLRDRIKALTQVQQSQGINPRGVEQADVIALHLDHGQACVQVFFIRAHQSWGNRDFYPKTGAGAEEPEIMEAILAQFYDDKDPPPLILLSHPVENPDLVGQLLSERAGRKVELAVPLRGEKAELLENAARNARESLARRMSESSTQNTLLRGLAEAFDLDAPPMRIEVYDNAHIQGSDAVGGMIVAGAEGFLKSQYRKFNIKSAAGANSDDFGMMREVMTRRFERLLKEDPERKSDAWPDLLLIDGGAGQISAVAGIFSAILLPPAHLTIAVSQPDPVGQLKAGFGYALKHAALPSIIALLAMNQAFGGAMDGMWPIFGLQAGLPRDQTALLVGGISIAQAIGAAMAHRLRAHQPVLFQLFFALIGLLLVTGASIFQPWTVGLIMVICGLFKVVEVNFDGRLHHSIPSEMRATIASVKTFASQIVMTAVLPIFGQLAGATSYRVAFFTCGLVIMATGLSFALLDRRRMASGS
jgi:hypothetical protein